MQFTVNTFTVWPILNFTFIPWAHKPLPLVDIYCSCKSTPQKYQISVERCVWTRGCEGLDAFVVAKITHGMPFDTDSGSANVRGIRSEKTNA